MAGGLDEKWTRLGGESRRHFQLVNGERVIDRIVRQLAERGVSGVGIICPDIDGYDIPGTHRVRPTFDEWGREAENGQAEWSDTDRTLMVYGDTIFSEPAMDVIVGFAARTFQIFGRYGNGVIKGGGGEMFALSFWPEHREPWVAAIEAAFALKARGVIRRACTWEAYRYMAGARGRMLMLHRLYPALFTNIRDGLTDDFDTPEQFRKLEVLFR